MSEAARVDEAMDGNVLILTINYPQRKNAIALGVRAKVPILVAESVMDEAGVELSSQTDDDESETIEPPGERGGTPIPEEKLSVFRDFINSLDIDDLDKKRD